MVIQHNMASMFTQRQLGITTGIMAKSSEKLSSGYRINRAADDAAGLAISEKMRRQIRGLSQNMENIQDGISFVQVADGYLNEVHDMLQRINELSVKGANGTLTSKDRSYIDTEVQDIKDEIERIFKTATFNEMKIFKIPYSPTVEPDPEPYDMQVFYSSPGTIGGLEFNNIRYNLSELAAKGLSLDANGKATDDQTVEFKLYDDENVILMLNKGDSLSDVVRKYEWKADSTGIKVNGVDATTWSALGVSGNGKDAGTYSFSFHGMKVTFEIEDGDGIDDIIKGINGDSITDPSHWTISQSSVTGRSSVSILGQPNSVKVTQLNKNNADDKFEIVATANDGLAIKRTDRYDSSETSSTSYSAWSGFKNISGNTIPRTPAEETNGGYPIVDWGLDNDSNDASQITFDSDAIYQYNKTLDNMQINYKFQLADVASQADIVSSFNGTNLGGSVSPGTSNLTSSNPGKLSFTSAPITQNTDNAFVMQRAFGRDFDANTALSGNISWTKTNTAESAHTLSPNPTIRETGRNNTTVGSATYFYKDDDDNYHMVSGEEITTTVLNKQRDEQYTWTKTFSLTIDGSLGSSNMADNSQTVVVNYTQNKTLAYTETYSTVTNRGTDSIIDEETFNNLNPSGTLTAKHENTATVKSAETTVSDTTNYANGTKTINAAYVDSATNAQPFQYTYKISYADIVGGNSGSTSFTLSFNSDAYRNFSKSLNSSSVGEYDFMNIVTVPPKKDMIIQATPDSPLEDQIPINWSALNLSVIGMTGVNTLTQESALGSIDLTKQAMEKISLERTNFGAAQNRLEHAYNYTANARENTQHSESVIRDTEMNSEIMRLRNTEILAQAGQAMLAQANQSNQGVLSLLQ